MEASVTEPREKYLDLNLGKSRYIEVGAGEPVVMLHGMGAWNSANSFDPIIPDLARNYRVLALDQLGFGKGERQILEGPTFELIVEHIRQFMDALKIDASHFIGHSMGGWMAARLAYESPDRVKKLVLLNAAGLNAKVSGSVEHMKSIPSLETLAGELKGKFREPSSAGDGLVQRLALNQREMLMAPGALQSLDPLIHQMQTPALRSRYLLHRCLDKIKAPSLVVWGRGDRMDPYPTWTGEFEQLQGDMRKSSKPWVIPGARYVLVDTGHHPHWEKPQYLAELIGSFLKSSQ